MGVTCTSWLRKLKIEAFETKSVQFRQSCLPKISIKVFFYLCVAHLK